MIDVLSHDFTRRIRLVGSPIVNSAQDYFKSIEQPISARVVERAAPTVWPNQLKAHQAKDKLVIDRSLI